MSADGILQQHWTKQESLVSLWTQVSKNNPNFILEVMTHFLVWCSSHTLLPPSLCAVAMRPSLGYKQYTWALHAPCRPNYNYNACCTVILHHIPFTHLTGHHTLWTLLSYCDFLIGWHAAKARMESQSGPFHAYWIQNHLIWNLASGYNMYDLVSHSHKEYVKPFNPEIHKMQIFFISLCKWDQSKIEGDTTRR